MKINEIILNELKEYIDPNMYGAWINIDGRIDNVMDHSKWLREKYYDSCAYALAFEDGWVRIVNGRISLDIEGEQENIKKTFKYWWPSAITKNRILIEKRVDASNRMNKLYKTYKIPEDKAKLLKDFGPQLKTPLLSLK